MVDARNRCGTAAKTLDLVKACHEREPRRPVVCGEACYERHMQTNFEDIAPVNTNGS